MQDNMIHPLGDALNFTAYEQGIRLCPSKAALNRPFSELPICDDNKLLVRRIDGGTVRTLAVVGRKYRTVQNDELFAAVEEQLIASIGHNDVKKASVIDSSSYFGKQCMRQYVFPTQSFQGPQNKPVNFRTIVQNGFGGSSIKIISGAIDFFCTNGMILGQFDKSYRKHTSGLSMQSFRDVIDRSVVDFYKMPQRIERMIDTKVQQDAVVAMFERNFSDLLARRLTNQYELEQSERGENLWSVYSALTYYASHNEGDFSVKNSANDHIAATMLKREETVRKIVGNDELFEKVAA